MNVPACETDAIQPQKMENLQIQIKVEKIVLVTISSDFDTTSQGIIIDTL